MTCCNCGATSDVDGGLELTDDLDRWICRDDLACIARAGAPEPALDSWSPSARRTAIDADFKRRRRRKSS